MAGSDQEEQMVKQNLKQFFAQLALVLARLALILPFALFPGIVQAQTAPVEFSSAYTKLDLDKCHLLTQQDLGLPELTEEELGVAGGRWLCVGYNNFIVYVAEGDLRQFVSYGANAMNERAAEQTLPAFNYVGKTIEWRVKKINNEWVPFATILRWHTASGEMSEDKGEVLVVTKLEPGNTCHVASIDAKMPAITNPKFNANEIARDFADNEVAGFDCQTDDILFYPS